MSLNPFGARVVRPCRVSNRKFDPTQEIRASSLVGTPEYLAPEAAVEGLFPPSPPPAFLFLGGRFSVFFLGGEGSRFVVFVFVFCRGGPGLLGIPPGSCLLLWLLLSCCLFFGGGGVEWESELCRTRVIAVNMTGPIGETCWCFSWGQKKRAHPTKTWVLPVQPYFQPK